MSARLTVLAGGRVLSGTYSVANDFVSVSCGSARLTGRRGRANPRRVAEMLLRQLAAKTPRSQRDDH